MQSRYHPALPFISFVATAAAAFSDGVFGPMTNLNTLRSTLLRLAFLGIGRSVMYAVYENAAWAEHSLRRNGINVLNGLSHQRVSSAAREKVTYFGHGVINTKCTRMHSTNTYEHRPCFNLTTELTVWTLWLSLGDIS